MANIKATGMAAHIAVIDGRPTTTTRDIADVYEKRHDSVLKIVRQRMAEAPAEWCLHNFVEASINVPQPNGGTATYPVIRMTKKGFHFVVGKFTGAKAVQHQLAFADEFERMEAALAQPKLQAPAAAPAPRLNAQHTLQLLELEKELMRKVTNYQACIALYESGLAETHAELHRINLALRA